MPKVSVIVPIYNVEQYIERCARSLFEQTLDDLEYIFINDCTPDKSMEVLASTLADYPSRKKQVKIIEMPVNSGQAKVRKAGIEAAAGDYIIHCDSDDWIEKDMAEVLYETAIETSSDLIFCDIYKEYPDNRQVLRNHKITTDKHEIIGNILTEHIFHFLCGGILKRSIFTDNLITWPSKNSAEDFALMVQLAYYANKISFCDKVLYHYRFNPASTTGDLSIERSIKRCEEVQDNVQLIHDFMKEHALLQKYHSECLLLKYSVRKQLKPFINDKKIYALWKGVFPEIEKQFLKDNGIALKHKISYLISFLRLEPYYRPIYNWILKRK